MSVEVVAKDGSSDVLQLFPSTNQIETVRIMLGMTCMVELKTSHGDDGTTSLDVHLPLHLDSEPPKVCNSMQKLMLLQGGGKQRQRGEEWVKEMRGWLMVLASVLASMSFQAGLNPPGFGQDESTSAASSPSSASAASSYPQLPLSLENAFFWLNSLAFAYSLSMVMLLLSESIFYSERGLLMLRTLLIVNILIVSAAYDVGSGRNLARSLVPAILLFGVFITSVFNIWQAKRILDFMPVCSKGFSLNKC